MNEQWRRWATQFNTMVLPMMVNLEAQYQLELRKQACFDTRENREVMWQAWMSVLKSRQRTKVRFK